MFCLNHSITGDTAADTLAIVASVSLTSVVVVVLRAALSSACSCSNLELLQLLWMLTLASEEAVATAEVIPCTTVD